MLQQGEDITSILRDGPAGLLRMRAEGETPPKLLPALTRAQPYRGDNESMRKRAGRAPVAALVFVVGERF
jgi:hypothetical protein